VPLYSHWHMVPILNLFYDVLFRAVPDNEEVQTLLNNIGLMSALMLTIDISIATCFSYSDIDEARARFSGNGTYAHVTALIQTPGQDVFVAIMTDYTTYLASSTYLHGNAIMGVIILLLTTTNGMESANKLRGEWWKYARIVICYSAICAIAGTILVFAALNRAMFLKYPDFYVEKQTTIRNMYFPMISGPSIFGIWETYAFLCSMLPTLLVVLLLSFAKMVMARQLGR
jgi:hypothetical protein